MAVANNAIRPLLGGELVPLMSAISTPVGFADALLEALFAHGDRTRPLPTALHPAGVLIANHMRFAEPLTAHLWALCCGTPSVPALGGAEGPGGQQTPEASMAGAPGPATQQGAGAGSGGAAGAGHTREGSHHLGLGQDTLCVELKPKCGCLPTSAAIAPAHAIKRAVPRYALHQRLKLAQARLQPRSCLLPCPV